jgi:hypothetical protein
MNIRLILSGLAASAVLCAMPGVARAQIFVTNFGAGTIGEYTTSGATVNPALVSGLNGPIGIAIVSASVLDASSTWTLMLIALTATFGLKRLLPKPA